MRRLFAITLAGCLLPAAARAQTAVYPAKPVRIIVGFAAGGGIDAYARLLSRHLGRNIPGAPTVVVQNLPGAAGLTAVMSLNTPDGTEGLSVVAFNPAIVVQALLTPDKFNVDFSKLQWLGAIDQDQRVCYAAARTGIKTFDDMRKRDQIITGSAGAGGVLSHASVSR